MALSRILIVEDDPAQQLLIQKALEGEFDLTVASTYDSAIDFIRDEAFDLYLLDIMLVDLSEKEVQHVSDNGYKICQEIRKQPELKNKPVIFLTSMADVDDKVLGFQLGADDYIVKPCNPLELKARLRARIDKQKDAEQSSNKLWAGEFCLHLDTQRAEVHWEGTISVVDFTPIEFKLFHFLAKNKGKVLARELILEHVWGHNTNVMDRSVDTYIAAVRKKLGVHSKVVKSVHGVGYKFDDSQLKKKAS